MPKDGLIWGHWTMGFPVQVGQIDALCRPAVENMWRHINCEREQQQEPPNSLMGARV